MENEMNHLTRLTQHKITLLGLALILVAACGGGGGGGGGPVSPPPPAPTPKLEFTGTGTPTSDSIFLLRNGSSTLTHLVLEVRTQDVSSLYGVAFDLEYPAAQLDYLTFSDGGFLGSSTSVQVVESSDGTISVGITRLGAVGGVGGSGNLLTLEFGAIGNGQGAFDFPIQTPIDNQGNPLAITWLDGVVDVLLASS